MSHYINRRKFISQSTTAAAAVTMMPNSILASNSLKASESLLSLGYIGLGKQSLGLLKSISKVNGLKIVACCDVDSKKLDRFQSLATISNTDMGNPYEVVTYKYYRELLDRNDIDAVVIASPDHWHAQMAIDAAKAGKDIYCEKPLALTVAEGRAMVNATRKYKRVFQTGSMQRSSKEFRHAVELIRNGYIGEITEINVNVGEPVKQCDLPTLETPVELDWNEWIGPSLYRGWHPTLAPVIEDDSWAWWRGYRNFGGGYITDWGAHMFDIVQWAMDMDESGPVAVFPPEEPNQVKGLSYKYRNGVLVNHKDWGQNNAIQFIGTEGRIEVKRGSLVTFPDIALAETDLKESDERVYFSDNHYQDWIDAIKNRTKPVCDVEIGHRTSSLCNIINIAYELQRPLYWDSVNEKFKNDDLANQMLTRPYRGKWDYTDY